MEQKNKKDKTERIRTSVFIPLVYLEKMKKLLPAHLCYVTDQVNECIHIAIQKLESDKKSFSQPDRLQR